jgi:hypothetical protein
MDEDGALTSETIIELKYPSSAKIVDKRNSMKEM